MCVGLFVCIKLKLMFDIKKVSKNKNQYLLIATNENKMFECWLQVE